MKKRGPRMEPSMRRRKRPTMKLTIRLEMFVMWI